MYEYFERQTGESLHQKNVDMTKRGKSLEKN